MNIVHSSSAHHIARSWPSAYLAFLKSRDESLILKAAPIILIFGSPEVIVSNLIPIVGEALDIGTFGVAVLVIGLTARAVRKYR